MREKALTSDHVNEVHHAAVVGYTQKGATWTPGKQFALCVQFNGGLQPVATDPLSHHGHLHGHIHHLKPLSKALSDTSAYDHLPHQHEVQ